MSSIVIAIVASENSKQLAEKNQVLFELSERERAARQAAEQNEKLASEQTALTAAALERAEQNAQEAEASLYTAHISLASQYCDKGYISSAQRLLESHTVNPGEPDYRGFEWYRLKRRCDPAIRQFRVEPSSQFVTSKYIGSTGTLLVFDGVRTINHFLVANGILKKSVLLEREMAPWAGNDKVLVNATSAGISSGFFSEDGKLFLCPAPRQSHTPFLSRNR